jgi:hypothetical protein
LVENDVPERDRKGDVVGGAGEEKGEDDSTPTFQPGVFGPTSATTPAPSWPPIIGKASGGTGRSPVRM